MRPLPSVVVAVLVAAVALTIHIPSPSSAAPTTAGTEFWAVYTENLANGPDEFEILVHNPGPASALVQVLEWDVATAQEAVQQSATIAAGASHSFIVPSMTITGDGLTRQGVFHVVSDQPVRAYQFAGAVASHSNDATFLYPVAVLGQDYRVVTWNEGPMPSFVTVVATQPTNLSLSVPRAAVASEVREVVAPVHEVRGTNATLEITVRTPGAAVAVPVTVSLQAFQAYHLRSSPGADLTGTVVSADQPVAVFAGSICSKVGSAGSCDHLMEQVPPQAYASSSPHALCPGVPAVFADWPYWAALEAWEDGWLATEPTPPDYPMYPVVSEPLRYRVMAVDPGATTVTLTMDGATEAFTLVENSWLDIEASGAFLLEPSGRVVVLEVLGGDAEPRMAPDWSWGDPSTVYLQGTDHLSTSLQFPVSGGFGLHMASITAHGTSAPQVWLDGRLVDGWERIGTAPYWCTHATWLEKGMHAVSAPGGASVRIVGWDVYASYAASVAP